MSNFIEQCLRGDALPDEIEDFVEEWHNSDITLPIYTYLGMTFDEYGAWVEDSNILSYIITAHKRRITLGDAIGQNAAMAARSNQFSNTAALKRWLKSQGLL